VGAGAVGTCGAPTAALSREVGVGAAGTHGAPGATLSREVGARAAGTRDAPTATLSREVGVGATGTHGTSGAALCWEMGAGAQVTRGGPGAALNREVGTTPPSPLLCPSVGGQGVAPSRLGCRCLYLAATLLGLPPSTTSMTTITSTSTTSVSKGYHLHVVLTGFYSSHNIRCNCRGCQFVEFYIRLIL
jgi:hypothetical protein